MEEEKVISLPGLTIYPNQRKIYRDCHEISLTTKEKVHQTQTALTYADRVQHEESP